ncbi:MAG: hypothetical protein ABII13_01260 [Patescibacteria group bacterium]|nr:hypothetical protein [Patescibacteria group bacterium]
MEVIKKGLCKSINFFAEVEVPCRVPEVEYGRHQGQWHFKRRNLPHGHEPVYLTEPRDEIVLHVELESQPVEVWIRRHFRRHFSRITEKRRKAIRDTMPETIGLIERQTKSEPHRTYYVAVFADMDAWIERVNARLNGEFAKHDRPTQEGRKR